MKERLRNILLQAKSGRRNIDELHKELCDLYLVSKSFECCKEENKCSKQCNDCKMVYNCF
jgi:hypothetical protein